MVVVQHAQRDLDVLLDQRLVPDVAGVVGGFGEPTVLLPHALVVEQKPVKSISVMWAYSFGAKSRATSCDSCHTHCARQRARSIPSKGDTAVATAG